MFKELGGCILKCNVMHSNFNCHVHQVQIVHTHPACPIGLLQLHFTVQLNAAVKYPYIIKSEKAPFKNVVAVWVFSIDPPREIDNLLLKNPLKKSDIPFT